MDRRGFMGWLAGLFLGTRTPPAPPPPLQTTRSELPSGVTHFEAQESFSLDGNADAGHYVIEYVSDQNTLACIRDGDRRLVRGPRPGFRRDRLSVTMSETPDRVRFEILFLDRRVGCGRA